MQGQGHASTHNFSVVTNPRVGSIEFKPIADEYDNVLRLIYNFSISRMDAQTRRLTEVDECNFARIERRCRTPGLGARLSRAHLRAFGTEAHLRILLSIVFIRVSSTTRYV